MISSFEDAIRLLNKSATEDSSIHVFFNDFLPDGPPGTFSLEFVGYVQRVSKSSVGVTDGAGCLLTVDFGTASCSYFEARNAAMPLDNSVRRACEEIWDGCLLIALPNKACLLCKISDRKEES